MIFTSARRLEELHASPHVFNGLVRRLPTCARFFTARVRREANESSHSQSAPPSGVPTPPLRPPKRRCGR
eukprot:6911279-Prymnesium_polylepis.1